MDMELLHLGLRSQQWELAQPVTIHLHTCMGSDLVELLDKRQLLRPHLSNRLQFYFLEPNTINAILFNSECTNCKTLSQV